MFKELGQLLGGAVETLLKNPSLKDGIRERFSKKHRVLVLGSTGVGKTQMISSLHDALPDAIDRMNRTESLQRERIKLLDTFFDFDDAPGQEQHLDRRREAIRGALRGDVALILNVVANGYHENKTPEGDVFGVNGDVYEDYLEKCRLFEMSQLKEWTDLLGDPKIVPCLVTVVNKADLWWDGTDAGLRHYESGAYFNALGEAQKLQPVVLPYSAVFHRFYGRGHLSGYVDDADRKRMREHTIETLVKLIAEQSLSR